MHFIYPHKVDFVSLESYKNIQLYCYHYGIMFKTNIQQNNSLKHIENQQVLVLLEINIIIIFYFLKQLINTILAFYGCLN